MCLCHKCWEYIFFSQNTSLKVDKLLSQICLNVKTFTLIEAMQEYVRQYTNTKQDHNIILKCLFPGQAVLEIITTVLCQLW